MDSRVAERLDSKIAEASLRKGDVKRLMDALGDTDVSGFSVVVGMLYNSFYYQTRRICQRDPTDAESAEFAEWLIKKHGDIKGALG